MCIVMIWLWLSIAVDGLLINSNREVVSEFGLQIAIGSVRIALLVCCSFQFASLFLAHFAKAHLPLICIVLFGRFGLIDFCLYFPDIYI